MTSMLRQNNQKSTAVQKALCASTNARNKTAPESNTAALRAECNNA